MCTTKKKKALYIPSKDTFVETATFNPTSEFENRFIFLDDTDTLYKYIGLTEITIDPTAINFEDTLLWENQGKQLNGYIVELSYPDVSPLYWEDIGYVNTRRAFDESSSSQTISDLNEDLVFTFQTGNVDRIALFGVSAKEIKNKSKTRNSTRKSRKYNRANNTSIYSNRRTLLRNSNIYDCI